MCSSDLAYLSLYTANALVQEQQREFALLGQIAINLELGEAPWIRRRRSYPGFEQVLMIAVILLQMMGPKEETFRPRYFGVPGHYRISRMAG